MPDEVVQQLQPQRGGLFVDCTVGLGGHTRLLLEAGASRVVGLDRDPAAVAGAREALSQWGARIELIHADYRNLAHELDARGIGEVDGMLADLGVSSMQLEAVGRGFSFRRDEPLDMRMDPTQGPTGAELLANIGEKELADLIYEFGEERQSRPIARALVTARERQPLTTTGQVADVIRRAIRSKGRQRLDPATRTFQALRIGVNRELEGLGEFLDTAAGRLARGGRLAVITFHSLEDRIVKWSFRGLAEKHGPAFRILTKRPMVPTELEVERNPRARSAKLRVVERA